MTRIAEDVSALEELKIPLGWGFEDRPVGGGDWLATIALNALGLLLTAAALTLGAPFWFDTLSKVARIRSAGRRRRPATLYEGARASRRAPVCRSRRARRGAATRLG